MALALPVLAVVVAVGATRAQSAGSLRSAIALRYPDVEWVDGPTLRRWLARRQPPVVLLDARAPAEFRVSHLAGARRVDPDHPDLGALRPLRSSRVVVYCSVGWRSAVVADRLRQAGFTDVHNLEGGIFEWANARHPVVRGEREVRAVHPYDEVWGRMLRPELRAYEP